MTPKSICPSCRELAAGVCDARQDEGHDDGIGPSRCAERIRSLPTHPEGELSGEQIEEIHEWLTVLPFAENMKAAQAKHIEQMNALCNMALRTHDLQARLDAAMVDAEKWREQQRLLRSNGHDIDEFYKDDAAILAEKERNNG